MRLSKKIILSLLIATVAIIGLASNASASGKKIADISQYQGNINWAKASTDLKYVIIRAQRGSDEVDTKKDFNTKQATKYNVPFGQYARTKFTSTSEARKEARDFYKRSNKNTKFYVMDNETRFNTRIREQKFVDAWYSEMRKLTNKPLIYYSYQNFVHVNKINYSRFDGSWIANYSTTPDVKADLHQYTSTGRVKGISGNVDLDRMLNPSKVNSWFKGTTSKASYYTKLRSNQIVTKKNINEYSDVNLRNKVGRVTKGSTLDVIDAEKGSGRAYRFKLSNGNYVSANTTFASFK
ncbi:1,4-beta-N-acetylmuramidase [Lactobacillus sp. S2-2]|uniref:GH25 family lysozyme n=1 Tax=Lactobacillus sp. S2-2 TaxID=2692917 RepID=UPI001F42F1C4|nr:GH25 family lysozyme [Lactobacillus sp. S2-2]MCF6514637.1 1,4-beta-N-acetylmuramidase [Lactobacillus sp. S2-2]